LEAISNDELETSTDAAPESTDETISLDPLKDIDNTGADTDEDSLSDEPKV